MKALLAFAALVSALVGVPGVLLAQTVDREMLPADAVVDAESFAPPAYVAVVDGAATVERDGVAERAVVNAPFVPGDRLRTARGRVEVLFADGTALDVDENSAVDLQAAALLRLTSGRLLLIVSGASDPASAVRYQVDTPAASVRIEAPGEYRVAARADAAIETELAVMRGSASLTTDLGTMPLGAGERAVARGGDAPAFAEAINSARFDAFDWWSAAQRDARTAGESAQYLPTELQMYGATLDRDGSWEYVQPYGYVWYPSVGADWRPYYHGYWASRRPWGWTWIGLDRWAWATHHYGRWGFLGSRWYWIPGRSWGAAWVSWAAAADYVSWCPLGFDGRPVFVSRLGFENRWGGWTIVPRHAFGASARADRFAVAPHTLPATTVFTHRAAPIETPRAAHVASAPAMTRGIAVPRGDAAQAPTYAVPRASIAVPRQPPVALPHQPAIAVPREPTVAVPYQPAVPRQPTVALPHQPAVAVPRQPADVPSPMPPAAPAPEYRAHQAVPRGPAAAPSPAHTAPPAQAAPPRTAPPAQAAPAPAAAPRATPPPQAAPHEATPRAAPAQPAGGSAVRKQ